LALNRIRRIRRDFPIRFEAAEVVESSQVESSQLQPSLGLGRD